MHSLESVFYAYNDAQPCVHSKEDFKRAVQFLDENLADYLKKGKIYLANLLDFAGSDFYVAFDEYHLPLKDCRERWKVLAIACINTDGSLFRFISLRVKPILAQIPETNDRSMLGSDVIYKEMKKVLKRIEDMNLEKNLLAIICDGCYANNLAANLVSVKYPVLWDITHLTRLFCENKTCPFSDRILKQLYDATFTIDNWREIYSNLPSLDTVPTKFHSYYSSELMNIEKLVETYFTNPRETGMKLRLNKANCNQLETSGSVIKILAGNIINFAFHMGNTEFHQDALLNTTRLVGALALLEH